MFAFLSSIAGKIVLGVLILSLVATGGVLLYSNIGEAGKSEVEESLAAVIETVESPADKRAESATQEQSSNLSYDAFLQSQKQEKPKEENFKEFVIEMFLGYAEGLSPVIEAIKLDTVDLVTRKEKLVEKVGSIKNTMYFTNLDHDTILFNQMLDLIVAEYEKEIKYIGENITYINSNVALLESYRSEYNRLAHSLLANSQGTITRAVLVEVMERYRNVDMDRIYGARENVINALRNHYQAVITYEDRYASAWGYIRNALDKIGGTSESISYQPIPSTANNYSSQGLDASNQRYIERAEMILNPVRCQTTGSAIGGSYYANTTCY